MIAALAMYDMPEIRAETDALWAAIRDAFRDAGVSAPDELTRPVDDPWPLWRDPDLVLSQTCGLPYSAKLAGHVTLLGAPAYQIPDAKPGYYYSEIVVRADDPAQSVAQLSGRRFAFNMRESQSGWAAPDKMIGIKQVFGELVETGGHATSAQAVLDGAADVAALDAVTSALLKRHDKAMAGLRVIGRTPETPGLPYITRPIAADQADQMASAIADADASLPSATRDALLLSGFERLHPEDYAPLAAGWGDAG